MKKAVVFFTAIITVAVISVSFRQTDNSTMYLACYTGKIDRYKEAQQELLELIQQSDIHSPGGLEKIKKQIQFARLQLKSVDFWTRYLEPVMYKRMNGPLPVEWETEVFEKFEKPYKREGAGLTLAELYLEEENMDKDSLCKLVHAGMDAYATFSADSITSNLQSFSTFYLCNRLYLLNLAAIYTTGFECPDTLSVIPELQFMMKSVVEIYQAYNGSFADKQITADYLSLYSKAINFVQEQPQQYSSFDHFIFIRDYVNPLFALNQQMINNYGVSSKSVVDYSLNKTAAFIFSKELYNGQISKGIFLRVKDEQALAELDRVGKMLFYDPILSSNNQRSCVSCHKPTEYFTDTTSATALQLNGVERLARNTPSLINATYNHLLMLDGKHISMQDQAKAVITSNNEMGSSEAEILQKVLSCATYKKAFTRLLKYTPLQPEISFEHISSALTFYYAKFSNAYAPFDDAINQRKPTETGIKKGFNIFMSKAQCATCHFVPQFNGVKPPYAGSEFEVLGVPADTVYKKLNTDEGRWGINPATETMRAFRTGTIRNADHTAPYMHNGVFKTMQQVIEFYDGGGGAGRGLDVPNQTLSSDSLRLTPAEKKDLMLFISSLNEKIGFEDPPATLPLSTDIKLNKRKVGGIY
jgi:cytochrome c peroxidase